MMFFEVIAVVAREVAEAAHGLGHNVKGRGEGSQGHRARKKRIGAITRTLLIMDSIN
jgi:hypothetical protein